LHFAAYLSAQTHDVRATLWAVGSPIPIFMTGGRCSPHSATAEPAARGICAGGDSAPGIAEFLRPQLAG